MICRGTLRHDTCVLRCLRRQLSTMTKPHRSKSKSPRRKRKAKAAVKARSSVRHPRKKRAKRKRMGSKARKYASGTPEFVVGKVVGAGAGKLFGSFGTVHWAPPSSAHKIFENLGI